MYQHIALTIIKGRYFTVMHVMRKIFNMMSDQEILKFKKSATTLIFEELLDHGNCDGYLLDSRLYASLCSNRKLDLERTSLESMVHKKLEETMKNIGNAGIKHEAKDKKNHVY